MYIDQKISTWVRLWIDDLPLNEAIEAIELGDYEVKETESLTENDEVLRDQNENLIFEIYNDEGKLLYDNTKQGI